MANYTPTFTKPYPSGWVDKPSKTTPATAAIMNSYDTAIAALEAYLRDNAIDTVSVSLEQFPSDGREWLGTITVGSNQYRIYMPSLKYENSVSDGIKIGTIALGEQSFDVYAPAASAGGSTVSVVPKTLTGTNIAEITVDGTTYQLYAPTSGGGSGSTVTAEATLTDGTEIGKITIDGVETILYAPNGGGGSVTVDSALSTESENPVQNKVVTAELNKKIETLDNESQSPDAVNFDLDSELSLTSVKGVQNKAIAEEFQKYANGTKVVAKAAEADTATKATQDAQGNVIDTTYAKKTEIPQGAVVDDSLSASSTNPVQNKVVKAEFDKVDSNLTNLKVSDVAGGKNLLNKNKFVPNITIAKDGSIIKDDVYNLIYVPIKANIDYVFSRLTDSSGSAGVVWGISNLFPSEGGTSSYNPLYSKSNKFNVKSNTDGYFLIRDRFDMHEDGTGSNWQLEEGTQATEYEPYIPSVKMLAEENAQQNDSLSVLGKCKNLLKPTLQTTTQNGVTCTNNGDGTYTLNGTATEKAVFYVTDKNANIQNYVGKKLRLVGSPKGSGNTTYAVTAYITPKTGSTIYHNDYGEGKTFTVTDNMQSVMLYIEVWAGQSVDNLVFKPMLTTNLNATYDDFVPYTGDGDTLTADVAKLNSDLSNIKDGTTPAAKAVADEDGNNIKSTYATKSELPSAPSSLYETVNVDIITDLFEKSITQNYVSCERVGNICTLSFWLQATANVDHKHRHELFDIDKIPKNNLTIGFCVVNFNGSVSNSANDAYNYINSISVEQYYNLILKRNISRVYLLPYHTDHVVMSSGNDFIGQISWAVEV